MEICIDTLKSNPEFYSDKVKLVSWPDGKACKHPSDFLSGTAYLVVWQTKKLLSA